LSALNGLGQVHLRLGRYEQAAEHHQQALRLARTTGHRAGELNALTGLGQVHLRLGRYEQAAEHHQQLLDLARTSRDRNYEFEAWQVMGRLRHATGELDAAVAHHERALALANELGQPTDRARAHDGLAHAYRTMHQHGQARQHWQHALQLITGLGIDHTEEQQVNVAAIRAHLAEVDQQPDYPG
jgi:tetratricopeptide (TPR) repeat protein